jgi:hypothetical protein
MNDEIRFTSSREELYELMMCFVKRVLKEGPAAKEELLILPEFVTILFNKMDRTRGPTKFAHFPPKNGSQSGAYEDEIPQFP